MSPKKKRKVSKGTGRRYTSEKPKPRSPVKYRTPPPPSPAEQTLRRRISQFGLSKRFQEDFEKAYEQYIGPGSIQWDGGRKILVIDEEDNMLPGYQEWYFFDYVLASGERIIDIFMREEGPQLPASQKKILDDWLRTNRLRLLETISVEPGIGETMQDLLSGEVIAYNDISFSYTANRWEIFLGRQLLTEGRWNFTGSGTLLTPLEKPKILKIAKDLWSAYQDTHPDAEPLDFYRDHSIDLWRAAETIIEERGKPKALYSKEGHPAISAKAIFAVKGDSRDIEKALDATEEFILVNEEEKGEYSGCLHYLWLGRGRSYVPEAPEEPTSGDGLILAGSWTAGPGEPDYTTLGDVYLCWEELTLICLSRERLDAGKNLLQQILGQKIKHQQDDFEDLRASWDQTVEEGRQMDIIEEDQDWDEGEEQVSEIVEEELIERETLRWLDTPDQKGLTPRQAAQTPEGREELRERMKAIEYLQDRALKSGKIPPMRLDIIRRELGL